VPTHFGVDAFDAIQEAAGAVGLSLEEDHTGDFVLINPAGGHVVIELKRMSLVSADGLTDRIEAWNRQSSDAAVGVVVADRVTQEARDVLRAAGWGWLDLRGHIHIVGPGLFVDTEVPALKQPSGRSAPLAGRVGVEVASVLLLDPDKPAGVRSIAGTLGRSASSVSVALSSMRTAGLLDRQDRAVVPDLFWELAARWQPARVDVQSTPELRSGPVNEALKLGFDDVASTGWALTDTVAAAAYGAPVSVRFDHPRDFYVPDQATLRRAEHLLGSARDHASRAATIRVAPVPMICSDRVSLAVAVWPLAQPLFVALDLAQDPGRGREILADWTLPQRWHRVW
jgi:hypothetical protein